MIQDSVDETQTLKKFKPEEEYSRLNLMQLQELSQPSQDEIPESVSYHNHESVAAVDDDQAMKKFKSEEAYGRLSLMQLQEMTQTSQDEIPEAVSYHSHVSMPSYSTQNHSSTETQIPGHTQTPPALPLLNHSSLSPLPQIHSMQQQMQQLSPQIEVFFVT